LSGGRFLDTDSTGDERQKASYFDLGVSNAEPTAPN
jgi:hypothetical protein